MRTWPVTGTRTAWWTTAVIALVPVLLVIACGSSAATSGASASPATSAAASSSPAAPSPASALCQDATALRTSIDTLTHISVNKGSASEIESNLADVQAKLTTFTTQAKGEWQTQTSDPKAALAKLQTATSDLASSPSASTVSGVVTALAGVTNAASSLYAAIGTECPAASPS